MDEVLGIFLILFVITPCLTAEVRNLTAVVGGSIMFPDPVTERGFLLFGPKLIASVSSSKLEIEEDSYTNRLHWNDGRFTFTRLQKNDSGRYTVDSKKGTIFSRYYELKLYDPVPVPVVSSVNVSSEVCTVQCSVNKTDQTTLSWFKEKYFVNTSSSGVLPLTVRLRDYTSNQTLLYTCVAQNPADRKTFEKDLNTICIFNKTEPPNYYAQILIPSILTVLILVSFAIYFVKTKFCKKEPRPVQPQAE